MGRGEAIPRVRRGGEPLDLSVGTLELLGEVLYVAALGGTHRACTREIAACPRPRSAARPRGSDAASRAACDLLDPEAIAETF